MNLDQGAIISGIRSDKYPENNCMGVVISASCDLANRKVGKMYYLTALRFNDWILTDNGFNEAYKTHIKSKCDNLRKKCADLKLDYDSIIGFNEEEINTILDDINPKRRTRDSFLDECRKCKEAIKSEYDLDSRLLLIRHNQDPALTLLQDIEKGNRLHYYFLPEVAFKESGSLNEGILIDLQDIGWISMSDCDLIKSPGIDTIILDDYPQKEQERLKKKYWLEYEGESGYSYVDIEYNIYSPWRESLLQKFSHGFCRIGLDNPTKDNYKTMLSKI